jgi:hypothetical protein
MSEPTYFPGRDYPDREVWLKKRYTPRKHPPRLVAHVSLMPTDRTEGIKGKTLYMGINRAKRALGKERAPLIKQRQEYYRGQIPA